MFVSFFNTAQNKQARKIYLSAILVLTYLVISSTSDATIVQNRGVVCFILLALMATLRERYKQ
jgi:hypothetical protein